MKTDGRPPKYTDEELLLELKKFRVAHPNQKIRIVDLERETDIPAHIWKYRLKNYIKDLNDKTIDARVPKTESFDLPSAHNMTENCMGNPDLMEQNFDMLLDIISTLQSYKDAASIIADIKKEYEHRIEQLEIENKENEKRIEALNTIINKYILDSSSKTQRKQQRIKNNVIQLHRDNMEQLNDMYNDLLK